MYLAELLSDIYVTQDIEVVTSGKTIYEGLCGHMKYDDAKNYSVDLIVATKDGVIRIFVK